MFNSFAWTCYSISFLNQIKKKTHTQREVGGIDNNMTWISEDTCGI